MNNCTYRMSLDKLQRNSVLIEESFRERKLISLYLGDCNYICILSWNLTELIFCRKK